MKEIEIRKVIEITKGKLVKGNANNSFKCIRLDSRLIKETDTFFCLKGENSDGHLYITQALKMGAASFVISDSDRIKEFDGYDVDVILVDDALIALQDLSAYYLSLMPIKKIVAVTGSVGKTTTRDMMKTVLSVKYKTASTIKNYNTPTWIPLSIFEFPMDTEACVIEMGLLFDTTEEALSRFVKPDIAIITNIGVSHIERFPKDGRMGILKSKMGVAHYFNKDNSLVLNFDNDLLSQVKTDKYNVISVGSNKDFEFQIFDVIDKGEDGISYTLRNEGKEYAVNIPVLGAHNSINSALAIAAGLKAGIDIESAIDALSRFELPDNRLSIREKGSIRIIDDCYNAAPESMKSALNTLVSLKGNGRRIAILGDMFELGIANEEGHREVGKHLNSLSLDEVILIGNNSKMIKDEYEKAIHFENLEDASKYINSDFKLKENDIILVKASNGMHLNKIVEEVLK